MFIAILSINHKKAPIAVREKVVFTKKDIIKAINKLNKIEEINSNIILSTCNRLEIYVSCNSKQIKTTLIKFLADFHNIKTSYIEEYLNYFEGENALNHICSVASGIDSLVIGEPQILGQLKDSYQTSKQIFLDKTLEKLFQHTFSTAKKVRSKSEIGKNPISIAYLGIKLSEKIFSNISQQSALLIGAGEMIDLSAQHLRRKNIKQLIVANRTKKNAELITKKYDGKAISLKQISDYIHQADIIITSTAAPIAIIGKGLIESAIKKRKHKPIFILDIAVPRDVEVEVSELADVYLYTVDDLNQVIDKNLENRKQAKEVAIEIINQQNKYFINYLSSIPQQSLIKNYHQNAEKIKQELLAKTLKKVTNKDTRKLIIKLADQLTNKLLHKNLTNIKNMNLSQIKECNKCIPKI